jgi:hypothetical protein
MDATNDGQTINLTCPITNTRFADDGSGSTHYSNGSDRTLTFCGPAGKLLKFDFGCASNLTIERIHPSDTLFIYNGSSTASPLLYAVTGNTANSNRLPYFDEASDFVFLSPGNCITFRFKSSAANNDDGWDACISCVDPVSCGNNEPASDLFGGAPFICNLNGYCGTTSANFGGDFPVNLNPSGGNCPSGLNFLGTIENNSWLKFVASAANVTFDFNVPIGGACINGIQAAIMAYNGTSLTRMSSCALSDGSHSGNFQLSASGLTAGETYYLMIDGNAGDVCDYTINANTGVVTVNAGPDQLCAVGSPIDLEATGPSGATYTWESLDGVVTNVIGANQTFNPAVTTTYIVEVSGTSVCNNQTDTVLVTQCSTLPVDVIDFTANCHREGILLAWTTQNERNNDFFTIEHANQNQIFIEIAQIPGMNTLNSIQTYTFNHLEANLGVNYYKLVQTDFDGTRTFLQEISINNTCYDSDFGFDVFYNPNSNGLEIAYVVNKLQPISMVLCDATGKIVFEIQEQFSPNSAQKSIPVNQNLAQGIYYLKFETPSITFTRKLFIKQL